MIALLLLFLQSLSEQGMTAMKENRFADAEKIYRQLLKQEPNEPRLRMNLALALFSGAKYEEAGREFDAFLKDVPAPGPAHFMLGVSRLKLRKPCEAVPALEIARKWQASPQVLLELGDAYFGCKRYAQAAATFEALGPTPKGLQGAGLSYARLGKQKEANAAFAQLEKLPPSAELHELLAEVRTLENRNDDAVREMQQAVRLSPKDPRIQRLYARSLWRAGQYDEARKIYEPMAARWSSDPEFNFEYGDTLVRVEGPEVGLPLLERAVKAAPDLVAARGALGKALLQVGRAKESIPHLDAAAQQDPTVLLPLSRAYRATGRLQEATRIEAEYKQRVSESQN